MRHDPSYLADMLLAARNAVEFADGLTKQQFEQDALRQNAVMKAVEIVGEAASRLTAETKKAHPEIDRDYYASRMKLSLYVKRRKRNVFTQYAEG